LTRIVARCALLLLAALLFFPCSTTIQRNVSVITLCAASLAADAAIPIAAGTPAVAEIFGFVGCEAIQAALGAPAFDVRGVWTRI
jgi:hypothetical protein